MSNIIEVNIKQQRQGKLIYLINLAGFEVIIKNIKDKSWDDCLIELIDKKSRDACKYSDLVFKNLYEAVIAVEPYLRNDYRIVA